METLDSNFLESDCIGEYKNMTYDCGDDQVIDTVAVYSEVIAREDFNPTPEIPYSGSTCVLCISTIRCNKCGGIHIELSDKTIGEQIEEFRKKTWHNYELYIGKTLEEFTHMRIGFWHEYSPCCLSDHYAVHGAGTYSVSDDDEPEDKDNYDLDHSTGKRILTLSN